MTWNVKGREICEKQLVKLFEEHDLHVLCLQSLPVEARGILAKIAEQNCMSLEVSEEGGEALAILSLLPINGAQSLSFINTSPGHGAISVTVGGLHLYTAHLPLGNGAADSRVEDKLGLLNEIASFMRSRHSEEDSVILAGSLAVAPLPDDVWSVEEMRNQESYSEQEHQAWGQLLSVGLYDGAKPYLPFGTFTCREAADSVNRAPRGRRLDHFLVSSSVRERVVNAAVVGVPGESTRRIHDAVMLALSSDHQSGNSLR